MAGEWGGIASLKEKGKELKLQNSEPRVLESGKEPGNSHFRISHLADHRPPLLHTALPLLRMFCLL